MEAYTTLEGWVHTWAPPGRGLSSPRVRAATRISIYQQGRLVGAATRLAETTTEDDLLATTASEAMHTAARTLLPRPDAFATEQLRLLAPDLTISLELAGPLTPLSKADLADLNAAIRPGLDGVAVRVGEEWAVAFPSELVAAGVLTAIKLPAMAARLLGDPTLGIELPQDLASRHSVTFYRFEVVHIAGVGAGGAAEFLVRGGRVVEIDEVTTAGLVRFAEELLGHFEATRVAGKMANPPQERRAGETPAPLDEESPRLGLMGTIDAARGVAESPIASPMQQSLAALSLVTLAETPRVSAAVRTRARILAHEIMVDLAHIEPGEIDPAADGVAAAVAWVVLARLDAAEDADLQPFFESCEGMLAAHAAAERGEITPGVAEAVLVWALAERAVRTGQDRGIATRDLRALYAATRPGGLVGLMPWLGWAELLLAGEAPVPAGAALRLVREQVWNHQLTLADTGLADRDLAGGVVFTLGAAVLPTWTTARPAALCATLLGDPRLTTPAEVSSEVVRLVRVMRFLRQLSAREAECAFYPRPRLVRGGIRAALWSPQQPPEASAMTLLAVCEFLRSIDRLENPGPDSP